MKLGIILVLLAFPVLLQGQGYLVLDKMGTKKRIEFYSGDPIKFRLKEEKFFRTDEIVALSDTAITFANGTVPFSDIAVVEHSVAWMQATGITLMVAGLGYIFFDQFNKVIRGDGLIYDEKVVRTGAILAGSGAALVYFSRKRIRIRKNWRLRLVDMY